MSLRFLFELANAEVASDFAWRTMTRQERAAYVRANPVSLYTEVAAVDPQKRLKYLMGMYKQAKRDGDSHAAGNAKWYVKKLVEKFGMNVSLPWDEKTGGKTPPARMRTSAKPAAKAPAKEKKTARMRARDDETLGVPSKKLVAKPAAKAPAKKPAAKPPTHSGLTPDILKNANKPHPGFGKDKKPSPAKHDSNGIQKAFKKQDKKGSLHDVLGIDHKEKLPIMALRKLAASDHPLAGKARMVLSLQGKKTGHHPASPTHFESKPSATKMQRKTHGPMPVEDAAPKGPMHRQGKRNVEEF